MSFGEKWRVTSAVIKQGFPDVNPFCTYFEVDILLPQTIAMQNYIETPRF
jgi:hypothetical protein